MNNKRKRKQYGLGSWLGDNASDILKTGAGAALTASGVGAPIGAGLLASGASGLAANNLVEDPNAKAAIQTAGSIGGMMGGAGLLSFAMGGNTQLSEINNGGTHEQNPNGGVPMGQTASVEQGETKWEDYIFSDRIKVPGAKHTFADESKKIQKKYPKERENDVPTQKAKEKEMKRLMAAQEVIRTEMGLNDESQVAAYGGRMKFPDGGSLNTNKTDTIFTNDPKDPRIKMYTDSLNLYKGYIFQKNNILPDVKRAEWRKENGYPERKVGEKSKLKSTFKPTPTALDKKNQLLKEWSQLIERGAYTEAKEFEKKNPGLSDDAGVRNIEELKKYLGKTKSDQSSIKVAEYYKKLGFPDGLINFYGSPDLYHPKIKPTGEYFDGIANSPIYKKPVQPVAYKNPESRIEITTDSKGRTVYPSDKVSDKAKKYFEENPSMFNAIGAPKMETTIDTNKEAIIKSLNNSKTVSGTPSSIPEPALKWLDEPGITGWQQAYDPSKKKTAYRPVTMGADGKPTYGPIEYKMGGRIKMNDGGGIDPNSFMALNQTLNPNLGNLGQASIPVPNTPIEEEYVAPTIYDTTPVETVKRTFSSDPASNNNLARTDFLGTEHPSFVTPATQTAKTAEPANTITSNNVTDPGLETPKPKGTSGFDKYDAITMGAQLLPAMYNIGQGLRKQKPVDLGRMTPNLVDYSASRKASEDSFNQQANILNEGIRENATSSGQALSNRVAFANRAALDKANQLGQINEREYNTNQQIRGDADQVNLQIRANEEQIDAQNKGISQTSVGMGLAQIGQAAGTINRDRNLRLGERETIGMMGEGLDFEYEPIPGTDRFRRIRKGTTTNTTTGKK